MGDGDSNLVGPVAIAYATQYDWIADLDYKANAALRKDLLMTIRPD